MEISKDLKKIFSIACRTDSTVLITGKTGTGKSFLARQIHNESSRRLKPFIAVNLATLHEGTLESELFGHERGAYTGADQRRVGKFELAQGGTIFLDEIGELTSKLQARFLEVLQSFTISPVGSNREVKLDIRIMAATHRNLEHSVAKGEFRADLYHRLRVVYFHMKPLYERKDEFNALVKQCLEDVCQKHRLPLASLSPRALERLTQYSWPGNIRELKNVFEYAMVAAGGNEIDLCHFPAWFTENIAGSIDESAKLSAILGVTEVPLSLDYQSTLSGFEREYLTRAVSRFGGKINRTARQIGMNKATLIRRLRAYGIHPGMRSVQEN
jgi:DNA-binding NtrC family response regulator